MNLKEKLPIAQRAIESISRHDDEDGAVVKAALDHIVKFCEAEKGRLDARAAERASEMLKA